VIAENHNPNMGHPDARINRNNRNVLFPFQRARRPEEGVGLCQDTRGKTDTVPDMHENTRAGRFDRSPPISKFASQ
jgi:hypothetical protein